ncbi:MAG: CusA/CzcA family heavy metal efflux RND transporter [candidate division FCPU426 bacterium]
MIERLIAWCAKHRWIVLGTTAALCVWAVASIRNIPIDAIPDLSDTQVIVYSKWDRSPDIMEDQVSYPIIRALLGAPKVKAVRGFSDFGYSYVYVIFEDGTDLYWARSRVLEYLSKIQGQLPAGVKTELGPDATSVGWVYQYALVDKTGGQDLSDLRSLQDWNLRFELQSVPGVAEVASLGGFEKQLQVTADPIRLQAYGVSILDLAKAVKEGNAEMGARVLEFSGAEFMVRGRGYARSPADLEELAVKVDAKTGTPIRVRDLAKVAWGPEIRRGVAELDGEGEAVGGIVLMRHGGNAPQVIAAVKKRLEELKPSLPAGVELLPVYDRSDLIHRAIQTIRHELLLEMAIVSLVILFFLWHIPSALIPIVTLPIAVGLAFIPMHLLGLSANIMSLAGIAVAIGAMVDASVVVVENSHKRLERWESGGRQGDYRDVLVRAIQEVGRPSFFSLLVIAVSFMPVFTLLDQEGRLFRPLAFTKNLSMLVAAVLAVTLDPAMRLAFFRLEPFKFRVRWIAGLANTVLVGKARREEDNPVSRFFGALYHPVVDAVLRHPKMTLLGALLAFGVSVPVYFRLGSEFMPDLDEGDLLYMPTALPGMSVSEATRILQQQDRILKGFPEVQRVFGKAGRAESSTDVAPFSMVETTIMLRPKEQWPVKKSTAALVDQMNERLRFAGIPNIWTMPIKNRIDMLSTGVRTPLGIKVLGDDLGLIEKTGKEIETLLRDLPGTRNIFSERSTGGYFLDVDWDRVRLARFGISVEEAQSTLAAALGGENVGTLLQGRARYGINVRFKRELRDDMDAIRHLPLKASNGAMVALGQLATVQKLEGPSMIRNEDGRMAAYVYIDIAGRDLGGYVEEAKRLLAASLKTPAGISLRFSGQYENMARVRARLWIVVPLTLLLVFLLIYANTRSLMRSGIVLLAVPFSLIGAVWLLWFLGYNMSIAVWVGLIALAGLDAETGIFMLLYLELAESEAKATGHFSTKAELKQAVVQGAVKRLRPKMMTVACALLGLLPIMFSQGSGSDVMKRIAAPMVGGLFSSFALELVVYPAVFYLWKWNTEIREQAEGVKLSGFWKVVQKVG